MSALSLPTMRYQDAINELAAGYVEFHNVLNDLEIYSIPDPQEKTVQLIEVSDSFPASGDLWPVRLRPMEDFPFESAVLIATKDEWKRARAGALKIRNCNWDLAKMLKVFPRD